MAMKVSRFALVYSPPTLMVEYQDMADDAKYVKKINIKNISRVKESDILVKELRKKYPTLLGPNVVEEAQIRGLVDRLLQSVKDKLYASNAEVKKAQPSSGTVMFKRAAIPTTESELTSLDLNVVSDEVNQTAKRIMDSKFLANRLKPGDPGYVYDKAVDFGGPTEAADWDEEDSSGGSGGSDADR